MRRPAALVMAIPPQTSTTEASRRAICARGQWRRVCRFRRARPRANISMFSQKRKERLRKAARPSRPPFSRSPSSPPSLAEEVRGSVAPGALARETRPPPSSSLRTLFSRFRSSLEDRSFFIPISAEGAKGAAPEEWEREGEEKWPCSQRNFSRIRIPPLKKEASFILNLPPSRHPSPHLSWLLEKESRPYTLFSGPECSILRPVTCCRMTLRSYTGGHCMARLINHPRWPTTTRPFPESLSLYVPILFHLKIGLSSLSRPRCGGTGRRRRAEARRGGAFLSLWVDGLALLRSFSSLRPPRPSSRNSGFYRSPPDCPPTRFNNGRQIFLAAFSLGLGLSSSLQMAS